jgi:trk system potassium uptake protein TrkA
MAGTKRVVAIGLGSFGSALARRLETNGCRVTGVDADPENIALMQDSLYEAVIGDATERETLEPLGLKTVDAVIISLGEDITRSLLAALHARELGARRVLVKGVTAEHGRLLKHLGVERVIFPEIEIAQQMADQLVWPNVIDQLPIDREYRFQEWAVPASLAGKTLQDADLRRRFKVWVVGVKDAMTGKLEMLPEGRFILTEDQIMLLIGKEDDLRELAILS